MTQLDNLPGSHTDTEHLDPTRTRRPNKLGRMVAATVARLAPKRHAENNGEQTTRIDNLVGELLSLDRATFNSEHGVELRLALREIGPPAASRILELLPRTAKD